jgi:hypothetical protein
MRGSPGFFGIHRLVFLRKDTLGRRLAIVFSEATAAAARQAANPRPAHRPDKRFRHQD